MTIGVNKSSQKQMDDIIQKDNVPKHKPKADWRASVASVWLVNSATWPQSNRLLASPSEENQS